MTSEIVLPIFSLRKVEMTTEAFTSHSSLDIEMHISGFDEEMYELCNHVQEAIGNPEYEIVIRRKDESEW